jgi:hypothetical protein
MIGSKPIENGDNSFSRAILWNPRPFFRLRAGTVQAFGWPRPYAFPYFPSFDAVGKCTIVANDSHSY